MDSLPQKCKEFINDAIKLCKPNNYHLCSGDEMEYKNLLDILVKNKTIIKLNEKLRPNSYLCRSSKEDVARLEKATYICSKKEKDAGPTNNWMEPEKMYGILNKLFDGCMIGRTMYIIVFSMGPIGSHLSKYGIEITDSPYVVVNMKLMTRMGNEVIPHLSNDNFIPCWHSVGYPLTEDIEDIPWSCSDKKYIVHFPEDKVIMSYGSGYGGNSLLGKKCLALRIGSIIARDEGWLAEHMLILSLTNPKGEKKYIAAAFPSSCGKTNLSMLKSKLNGWEVKLIGDDIAWMRFKNGQLYAINPEYGMFGVAPGTSNKTNPYVMEAIKKNTLFTNVALTDDGDVWWEGMDDNEPMVTDWLGEKNSNSSYKAHPNGRFTVSLSQAPNLDPEWNNGDGVPISMILFGGRRATTVPLVIEAKNWDMGVFYGTFIASELTAASEGSIGKLRHDPMAMIPFCGYNMGDYWQHWLNMGKHNNTLPKIFLVNWFRKNEDKYLWPGYGENIRVLKWCFERLTDKENKMIIDTKYGYLPKLDSFDLSGLDLENIQTDKLFKIHDEEWNNDLKELSKFYDKFEDKLPNIFREFIFNLS